MKYILLITLLLINFQIKAQALSFSDLKYILQHTTVNVDSYLANKNYYFMKSKEGETSEDCPSTTWAFKRNTENNRANSFIVKHCDDADAGFIFYQFGDKQIFENIKSYCESQSFKFIKKSVNQYGTMWFTYHSDKYKIEFGSSLDDKNNENVYIITLENL